VRINPAVKIALENELKEAAAKLRHPLDHIANEGWRLLTKLEYNLLGELAALCKRITAAKFKKISTTDTKLRSLRNLETRFLTCHYQREYPQIMKSALGAVLDREKRFEDDLQEFKDCIDFILLDKRAPSSLQNFIVGVNIVRHRRYIPFTGLINYAAGGIVNTAYFNCKRKTQNRINRHIDTTLSRLVQLKEEKTDIERTKLFLDFDENGEPDFRRLFEFIDTSNAMQGVQAESELQDMARFTLLLFSSFVREAAVFLNGTVEFEDGSKARIFAEDYFKFEVERLRYSISSLEEMQDSFPALSRVRFLGLREAGTAGGSHESEFLRLAAALVSFLLSIGKKLMHIKLFSQPSKDTEATTTPLDPEEAYRRIIPYQDSILKGGGVLGGMYVLEAVTYLVSLCHLVGLIYADPSVTVPLDRERPGEVEISGLVRTLQRLADPLQFQKIQEIHELDS
jgi:hypothetical protein